MFSAVGGFSNDLVELRPVYDNPPVIAPAPRWTRAARLVDAVRSRATHGSRSARASSSACACGTPSRG
jgi:hypothetical protein